jgi:hypothetical protein
MLLAENAWQAYGEADKHPVLCEYCESSREISTINIGLLWIGYEVIEYFGMAESFEGKVVQDDPGSG